MIRVAVTDDSSVVRSFTCSLLKSAGFEVSLLCENGRILLENLERSGKIADVILLDYEMPELNGLDTLKVLREKYPEIPVLMFSSHTVEGAMETICCLEMGAFDFITKPGKNFLGIASIREKIVSRIQAAAGVRTVAQKAVKSAVFPKLKIDLIAVGSSTGGVKSAGKIFPFIPEDSPPIVWAQHMPAAFTDGLAKRLDSESRIRVREAKDGDFLEKGLCLLAPGGKHMTVFKKGDKLSVRVFSDLSYTYRPSCNLLFESAAAYTGKNALGIILTGMGDDGTAGLKLMHDVGAYVIAQDEASSTVYGMPRSAAESGVVDLSLPDSVIAQAITDITGIKM